MARPMAGLQLFISYSHEDVRHRKQLETHLAVLRRQEKVTVWHDRRIDPGDAWAREIDEHLDASQIVVCLVTQKFLASDYCWDREMEAALIKHGRGELRVVPVLVDYSDWENSPLGALQALPSDGKPIADWKSRAKAWQDVVQGIRRVAADFEPQTSAHGTGPGAPADALIPAAATPAAERAVQDRYQLRAWLAGNEARRRTYFVLTAQLSSEVSQLVSGPATREQLAALLAVALAEDESLTAHALAVDGIRLDDAHQWDRLTVAAAHVILDHYADWVGGGDR